MQEIKDRNGKTIMFADDKGYPIMAREGQELEVLQMFRKLNSKQQALILSTIKSSANVKRQAQ